MSSTIKQVRAILVLPFMVTVVIPGCLLYALGFDTFGLHERYLVSRVVLPIVGVVCILFGLTLMVLTIRLFARIGRGTLAPWDPTRKLVAEGVYRHVRNPMISGVFFVLTGEAIATGSFPIACWAALFITVNAIYIPLWEEPGLARRFGEEYEMYRANVPRWIPRLSAWREESRGT